MGWPTSSPSTLVASNLRKLCAAVAKYARFVGPGAMVSVAYMDPGNYATDVAAGASYKFRLLFIVLLSNIIAIFLQSLSIKLGSVTGLNLAQMIKAHTHPYLNAFLYVVAEIAIISTDMAEVIGTAIALDMLFKIPLVAGCIISITDVLLILLFYSPGNSIRAVRIFELLVFALVLAVVVCFCYQLSLLQNTHIGTVLKGYIPNSAILQKQGIYQSCGILGATVMPHSLYLGSGTIQSRLLQYDQTHGLASKSAVISFETAPKAPRPSDESTASDRSTTTKPPSLYLPSLKAIRYGMRMSIIELTISLFTFALFINSAILIIAGASLYPDGANADLFSIHDLLSQRLAPAAGTLFATALLLSGISAGIVCTIAGQIISEGQVQWHIKPWQRRILTRSIAITPSVIIAGSIGKAGISKALEASQVVLCFCLPIVAAPLLWFTAKAKYQRVQVTPSGERMTAGDEVEMAEDEDVQDRERPSGEVEETPGTHARSLSISAGVPDGDARTRRRSALVLPKQAPEGKDTASQVIGDAVVASDAHLPGTILTVQFHNHWLTTAVSLLIWLVILAMNLAAVVMLALGVGS